MDIDTHIRMCGTINAYLCVHKLNSKYEEAIGQFEQCTVHFRYISVILSQQDLTHVHKITEI